MRVLVTGGKGQLGRAFGSLGRAREYEGCEFFCYDVEEMNILDADRVHETISALKLDAVVHAAAYTQVDRAETDKDTAFRLNVIGTQNVASACLENNLKMVYVSTDYVFDGQKKEAYTEFDLTNPLSVYGFTKLWGENMAAKMWPRLFIVRTAWLYGDGVNFVRTMLRLAAERPEIRVVDDQIGSPTYADDLARGIMRMIGTRRYGTYHMTNNGVTSWYGLAKEVFACLGIDTALKAISTAEYPTAAVRPRSSVLDNYMLRMTVGDCFRDWREALAEYLEKDGSW